MSDSELRSDNSTPSVPSAPDRNSQATVELLGVLAYGELTAFLRIAADAELAPTLAAKGELAAIAVEEFQHYQLVRQRLVELGANPDTAMQPFVDAFDEYHDRTAPTGWLEGLMKAYVGDGLAADFYASVSTLLDEESRATVQRAVDLASRERFLVTSLSEAIAADPVLGGRLALWGRRLVGEALSQGQRVAVSRPRLAVLIAGADTSADPSKVSAMFGDMTQNHIERMQRLGLDY